MSKCLKDKHYFTLFSLDTDINYEHDCINFFPLLVNVRKDCCFYPLKEGSTNFFEILGT